MSREVPPLSGEVQASWPVSGGPACERKPGLVYESTRAIGDFRLCFRLFVCK